MFMVTLPAGEFDSDSQPDTDSSEDHLHGYISLVPRGDALRVFRRTNGTYGFPVYPNLMHQWGKLNEVKDHVLGMAKFARLRLLQEEVEPPPRRGQGTRDGWSKWSERAAPVEDLCCYVTCDVN
jgi:hypothetical protein